MRTVCFDLETTGLNANFGRLLVASFKEVLPDGSGEIVSYRADDKKYRKKDPVDDSALAVAARDYIEGFDILVGHNSKMFDVRFLNARLMKWGERPLRQMFHIDTMWIVRSNLRISSKLGNLEKMFGLPTPKLEVGWDIWGRAHAYDKHSLDTIVERCESDTILLEEAFIRLKPLIRSIPRG